MKKLIAIIFAACLLATNAFADCDTSVDGHEICDYSISQWNGLTSTPALSPAGTARIYFDEAEGKLKCSEDGGAYEDCVGGGSGGGGGSTVTAQIDDVTQMSGTITIDVTQGNGLIATEAPANELNISFQDIYVNSTGNESVAGNKTFTGTTTGTFSGSLSGNATTATTATTATNVADADKGDVSISGGVWSVDANAVGLGTDTTGDFVATIVAGANIATTGASSGEGIAHSISLNLTNHDNIVYVGKWGNDSNDGLTANDAKLTIAAANTAATAGDTILVFPGTYSEVEIELKDQVNLVGVDKDSTIITGSPTEGTSISDVHGVVEPNGSSYIANLTIIDTTNIASKQFTNGITLEAANSTVEVENVYLEGGYDGIISASGVDNIDLIVRKSTIQSDFDPFGYWSDSGSTLNLYDVDMISAAARTSETEHERCVGVATNPAGAGTNTIVNVYGGSCTVNGASADTILSAFWIGSSSSCPTNAEATVNLYGVKMNVVGQSGDAAYALFANSGCPAAVMTLYGGSANVTGGSTNYIGGSLAGSNVFYGPASNTFTTTGTATFNDTIAGGETYGAGWNGDVAAARRDDVYDKIETLGAGSGTVNSGIAGKLAFYSSTGTTVDDYPNFNVTGSLTTMTGSIIVSHSLKIPNSSTPPPGDCDSAGDAGKIYMDTNGTTGQQIYGCEGATGWVLQGDGGGGGSGDIESVGDVTAGAAFNGTQGTTLTFNDTDGDKTFLYNNTTNAFEANDDLTVYGTMNIETTEATASILSLTADEGDDIADQWRIESQTDNDLDFVNGITSKMKIEQDGSLVVTGDGSQSTITEGLVVNNGQQSDEDDDFTVMCGATACLAVDAGDNTTTTTNQSVSGTMVFTTTGEIGFRFINGTDNTACNTQCTRGCFIGILNATGTAVTGFVNCSDATADECICGGGS